MNPHIFVTSGAAVACMAAVCVCAQPAPRANDVWQDDAGNYGSANSALDADGAYEPGFFWRRGRDWTVRPSSDNYTTNGNPDGDQLGAPVWHAVRLTGGGMDAPAPWWSNFFGTTLVWDPSWYGGQPCWAGGNDVPPPVTASDSSHVMQAADYDKVPGAWWINPLSNPAQIEVRGTLTPNWSGQSGGLYCTVDVVVAHYHAANGSIGVLWHTASDKPTRNSTREYRTLPVLLTNLVVQPGDRLLFTQRSRTAQSSYWITFYDAIDIIYLAPFYPRGHVWNRAGEWSLAPDSEQNSSAWNPTPDTNGMPVWNYVELSGGALGSATPWWSNVFGADLRWDKSWYGNAPCWAGGDDTAPAIEQTNLTHIINGDNYARVPGVWWISPSNGPMRVSLKGGVRVRWHGDSDVAQPVDVELAFAHYDDETRAVRLLHSQRLSKPHNNNTPESLDVPIHIPCIHVGPRDRILRTGRAVAATSNPRWVYINDAWLDIVLDAPHAATVLVQTQTFTVGFTALVPAQTATVMRADTLTATLWQAVHAAPPPGQQFEWSEPLAPVVTQRFFRVIQPR